MTDSAKPGRSRRRFTVDALFSDTRPQASGVVDLEDAKRIDLDRIIADPDQPRQTFDQERLDELAASISAEGVLQPIVVRYDESQDKYIIIHGERRYRASKNIGNKDIPALVRDVPAERRLIQQLMENVVRDDLNAVDRAAALRALRTQLGDVPWDNVAERVGIRKSRLFQLLGTEKLPEEAQGSIRTGAISEKQSRALQGLSPQRQRAMLDLIMARQLSAPVAMRLSQAFRKLPITDESRPEIVARALAQLHDFVDPATDEARQVQTRTLLRSIANGTTDQYAKLLALPGFQTKRTSKHLADLARDLAKIDSKTLATNPDTLDALRTLRDALDTVLNQTHKRTS